MNSSMKRTKLFVGGLSTDTTEGTLQSYFKKYGQLNECKLVTDKCTHNSKGFAFISLEDCSLHEKLIQMRHNIDGKVIECKYAYTKEGKQSRQSNYSHPNNYDNNDRQYAHNNSHFNSSGREEYHQSFMENPADNKMFVGGIHHLITEDEMGRYFSFYGSIERLVILKDINTGKSRGFGFVYFHHSNSIDKVIANSSGHYLRNKKMECKRATPKESYYQTDTINQTLLDYYRSNYHTQLSSNDTMYDMNNSLSLGNNNTRSMFIMSKDNYNPNQPISSLKYDSFHLSQSSNPYSCYPPDKTSKLFNGYYYFKLYDKNGINLHELLARKSNQNDSNNDAIKPQMPLTNRKTNDCDLSTSSEYAAENNNEEKKRSVV